MLGNLRQPTLSGKLFWLYTIWFPSVRVAKLHLTRTLLLVLSGVSLVKTINTMDFLFCTYIFKEISKELLTVSCSILEKFNPQTIDTRDLAVQIVTNLLSCMEKRNQREKKITNEIIGFGTERSEFAEAIPFLLSVCAENLEANKREKHFEVFFNSFFLILVLFYIYFRSLLYIICA